MAVLGVFGALLFLIFGFAQIVVGYMGIEEHLGNIWAIVALAGLFLFRFTLPFTVGAFFGAVDVLGWHWLVALVFVAPGLVFIVPSMITALFEQLKTNRESV